MIESNVRNWKVIIGIVVGNSPVGTYCPDLRIVPVYNRMYSHERRPAMISGVEMGEERAIEVRPPGAYKDSFYIWPYLEVFPERRLHRQVVACEVKMVSRDAFVNEAVDLGEREGRDDVHGLES